MLNRPSHRFLALATAMPLAFGALGACSKTETPAATTAGSTAASTAGSTAAIKAPAAGSSTTGSKAPATTPATTAGATVPATGVASFKVIDTPFGKAVGTANGKVVYSWKKETDAGNKIVCLEEGCLAKWPAVYADTVKVGDGLTASQFGTVARPDGKMQATLNGRPLYWMKADEPGDANCQGEDGWWIANLDGTVNTRLT